MGRGNTRLIAWDGDKTLTFTMEDALLSPESFAILSGAAMTESSEAKKVYVHVNDTLVVGANNKIELREGDKAVAAQGIYIMKLNDAGEIVSEPCIPSEDLSGEVEEFVCYGHGDHTLKAGDKVMVDYYVAKAGVQMLTITADSFGGNFYLEAETLFRRESDGKDLPAIFIIPNGRIQSNFSIAMASTGDPSTFTFTMDAFPGYTNIEPDKKVLAVIQIVDEEAAGEEPKREKCVAPSEL